MAYHLGFLAGGVSIIPDSARGTLGSHSDDPSFAVAWSEDRELTLQETAEAAAVGCYAGLAAEAHFGFCEFSWLKSADHGAGTDDRLAREKYPVAIGVLPLGWRAVARCRRRARRLVAAHAQDIERVARALVRFRVLNPAELEAVLGVESVAAASGAEMLAARRRQR